MAGSSSRGPAQRHLYGGPESPWTSAVMMFAHHSKQGGATRTCWPGFWQFLHKGCVMPVLAVDQGAGAGGTGYVSGSYHILTAMGCDHGRLGDEGGLEEADLAALETLFLAYALTRIFDPVAFVRHWAAGPDASPGLVWGVVAVALRALLCLYFSCLILAGLVISRVQGLAAFDPEKLSAALSPFERRLVAGTGEGPFFGGDRPSQLDFLLFGHVQCMTCGLSDPVLPTLAAHNHLMAWVRTMNRELSGYDFLYSRRCGTEPGPIRDVMPTPAQGYALQALFLVSLGTCLLLWPFTLQLLLVLILWRYVNPERSANHI